MFVFWFFFFLLFWIHREYPCDHYTSVINVTVLMTGCPRVDVHTIAVQLLQVLDKRFFGNVGPLQTEGEKGKIYFILFFRHVLNRYSISAFLKFVYYLKQTIYLALLVSTFFIDVCVCMF